MLPLSFAAIIFTIGLTAFLNNSFHSFKDFNFQVQDFNSWQEASLAGAKVLSSNSSRFISQLKGDLQGCLELQNTNEDGLECENHFQDLIENYQTSLNSDLEENNLRRTIDLALNINNLSKSYDSYELEYFHSNYLASAFKAKDLLYNPGFVNEIELEKKVYAKDFDKFLNNGKLKLSSKFLAKLFDQDSVEQISKRASLFNLELDAPKSLGEEDLANALKLSINFKRRLSLFDENQEQETKRQEFLSAGQLRLSSLNLDSAEPPLVAPPSMPIIVEPPKSNPGVSTVTDIREQRINFSLFDHISGRGILFDKTRPASVDNQIRIINRDQNRYTSIYPDANKFLQVNIGSYPKNASSVLNFHHNLNPEELEFASLVLREDLPSGHIANITASETINVDIVPRGRKKYMTALKDFYVNGRQIKKGSILIGTIETSSSIVNPKLEDLSNIRVYDQDTGALTFVFKPEDRPKAVCAGRACMNINQFNAYSATNFDGSLIHSSFSTRELFPGKDFVEANRLFTNIQSDLEANTVLGIYQKKYDWQKEILKDDLNSEQKILLTEIFAKYDTGTSAGRRGLAAELGLSFTQSSDSLQNTLMQRIIDSFVDFVIIKQQAFSGARVTKAEIAKAKNEFLDYRNIYQDYVKAKISSKTVAAKLKLLDNEATKQNTDQAKTATSADPSNQPASNTKTKPPAPVAPACLAKRKSKRSAKCKKKIKKYKQALANLK